MKICKYCKKPISDDEVWNPDSKGNGYHHACLCEMEFKSRDRRIYNKGKADVLEKLRAEIEWLKLRRAQYLTNDNKVCIDSQAVLDVIDKYRTESEDA